MSHYKPYTAYKESGVGWIEPIPKHWDIVRIKRFTTLNTARTSEARDNIPYIGLEDVESGSGKYAPTESNSRQSDTSTVGVFSKGQVLYGKLRPYLRKAIITDFDGVCSTEFLALQPDRVLPELLQNWLLSPHVTQQIESTCEGAKMPRADWEGIGNILMPLPPVEEQIVIRDRTRAEASRIDTLISKKARFIELLKEKRQALITHAVTKGLNSDVKMKDSGVEWIGEIPEHWKIAQFRRLVSIKNGSDHKDIEAEKGFPVYGSGGVFSYATNYIYDGESVLLGRKGTIDKPLYVNEKFWTVDTMYWTQIMPNVNGKFCYYIAKTIPFDYYATNTARPSMTQTDLGSHLVAFPDRSEQSRIASALDFETTRIDELISKTQKSIDLLKERRSAFITAAVTGQIDLQGEPA
ncbi:MULTISPECIES: restriction endonuclease subunit S [unclassified Methylophaga]|jgi:type I restriction enzyme S subunit|uniref:restriction endonuclease subunit S n=1 Tax=unclassified Methylophaga TaxID=2629249 RepID=UPI000C8ABBA1|nr:MULTISPECIES: restriction endonuclease subunit S [unclassified Methylophaga]MAP28199.1 restriction endonuclease subunit S [Methylophaga sp.]MTI63080.1 restriction endonuclease subunit S [Methylophaga sp.]HAD30379.1 restriction endonuclease subunit S [Methylophaga sp.]HBX59700.1 restriction endonuclease subunit S [Methylophaga sp.]|tara:strand:- start:6722 stop:7948 length:1227 start_codon:yes stop_codon:yes gene_type:complete